MPACLRDLTGRAASPQWGKTAEEYAQMLGRAKFTGVEGRQVVAEKMVEVLDARHEAAWHAAQENPE